MSDVERLERKVDAAASKVLDARRAVEVAQVRLIKAQDELLRLQGQLVAAKEEA